MSRLSTCDEMTADSTPESGGSPAPFDRRRPFSPREVTGDRAFAALFDELHPKVVKFMMRQTGVAQAALDLSAETFAKAYEKRRSFRGKTRDEAYAWIWAIARNDLAMYGRRRSVETAAIQRLGLERPTPSDTELGELETQAAIEELREHFRRELPQLPADQQEVIRLRFFDGLGNEEAAVRLGVSNDVVRARASRALRTLGANARLKAAAEAMLS
jgi:RNA polymerase sigma-70 factor, ECF subfamily